MKQPKISIIISTLNSAATLRRALSSVAEQTYPETEVILVDGGSRDDTVAIAQSFVPLVSECISEPDLGVCDAWNKGIKLASGDFIYFLGSDDCLASAGVLRDFVERIRREGAKSWIIYGDVHLVNSSGELLETKGGTWDSRRFRTIGMSIPHQGTFHDRRLFETYGLFEPTGSLGTYEMLLRYLKDHDAQYLNDFLVANMQTGGISNSPRNRLAFLLEYDRAQKRHGTYRFSATKGVRYIKAYIKIAMSAASPFHPFARDSQPARV